MILYRPINSQRNEQNSTGMFEFLCLFCFVPSSRLGCSNVVEIKVVCSSQIQLVVMCISPKIHLVAKCVFLKSSWSMSVCSSSPSDRREYFCFFSLALHQSCVYGFFSVMQNGLHLCSTFLVLLTAESSLHHRLFFFDNWIKP